jgi:hypothetical protein
VHPHAAWLPGAVGGGDVPPVWDVGFLVVPVVVLGVALDRLGLALELDWLAWRTRRRREP